MWVWEGDVLSGTIRVFIRAIVQWYICVWEPTERLTVFLWGICVCACTCGLKDVRETLSDDRYNELQLKAGRPT